MSTKGEARAVPGSVQLVCVHCNDPKRAATRPRGLCFRCFNEPAVRGLYPGKHDNGATDRMTPAELDAFIAGRRPGVSGC